MSDPDWRARFAASVTTWWEANPTVQQARTDHPELFNPDNYQWAITIVEAGLMAVEMFAPGILPHELHGIDQISEKMVFEGARGIAETFEREETEVQPETPQRPEAVTSVEIGGAQVERDAAEIKALHTDHEAALTGLHQERDAELKDRAEKDAALAEKLPADLGPGGQKMLDDAIAANQQQIKDKYAAQETDLRHQQGITMGALQAKQVAQQHPDAPPSPPPTPPPPPPPTRSL